MTRVTIAALGVFAAVALTAAPGPVALRASAQVAVIPAQPRPGPQTADDEDAARLIQAAAAARFEDDLAAMQDFRPGYRFWQHIFTIPDGSIAVGSALDGRLLAVLPVRGDWTRPAIWEEPSLADILSGQRLPNRLADRREHMERLIEPAAGPIVHNPTRGLFLSPNIGRYARFLEDWGAIYERFGVPAEVGLAQALVESGLNGTIRSEARAVGFCQWLAGNWRRLQRLAAHPIEGHNQTTQAPYCAAYLTVLAARSGSFIPALSEHHSGGTNVGRVVINGTRLGGRTVRDQYFLGAQFTRDLRSASPRTYRDVYGSYGPRSFYYSEMVFGNIANIARLRNTVAQARIHAMRTPRALTLATITRATGLSTEEVRRFNPALVRQVPAGANVYLPFHVEAFGPDVSFWHRPASPSYAAVLHDFLTLDATTEQWDDPAFQPVLRDFERRFKATNTEEGDVMSTVLAYTRQDLYSSRRGAILAEFRTSERILRLFNRALLARNGSRGEITSN